MTTILGSKLRSKLGMCRALKSKQNEPLLTPLSQSNMFQREYSALQLIKLNTLYLSNKLNKIYILVMV